MTDNALTGTVALVTGASSGIGAATARRLAQEGAAVGLVARRRQRLDQMADAIAGVGGTALVIEADITDPDRAAHAVHLTLDRFDRLDVLVNSAGIMLLGTALHTTLEEWDRMIALNVRAILHVTHAAVPYLIDAAATSPRAVADIVNVSSIAGRVARPSSSVYNLTRFGLNGFTEALRQELLADRVRVSVVEPGTVRAGFDGDLADALRADVVAQVTGVTPLRPEDVAEAITYVVTRDRRVAVNEIVIRAGNQTW